jgi:uncharacterized protein (TIGR04255 family)
MVFMNSVNVPRRIRYKKPPIVERIFTVTCDLPPEAFFSKFESWKEIIQPHFPHYDPHKDWKLNLEVKNGVPIFTNAQPEVQITHRFARLDAKGKKRVSMRLLPNEFSLNLHHDPSQPHYFEELFAEIENWVPQWIAHFGVKGCSSIAIDYINLISAVTTPNFVKDSSVYIGDVLTVFSQVPIPYHGIIPPYDCQVGLMVDPKRPATFAFRVLGRVHLDIVLNLASRLHPNHGCGGRLPAP